MIICNGCRQTCNSDGTMAESEVNCYVLELRNVNSDSSPDNVDDVELCGRCVEEFKEAVWERIHGWRNAKVAPSDPWEKVEPNRNNPPNAVTVTP